jgi:hypothetical protein
MWQRLRGERSAVRQAWEMGHALLRRDIPTPRPLAFVERPSGGLSEQLLLTEEIPHAVTLDRFLREAPPTGSATQYDRQVNRLAVQLGGELRRLHDAGFDHRALSPEAILVDLQHLEGRVWFLALDRLRQLRSVRPRHVVGTLASLNGSAGQHAVLRLTHRLRFVQRYLQSGRREEWKALWRDVQQQSLSHGRATRAPHSVSAGKRPTERTALARSA